MTRRGTKLIPATLGAAAAAVLLGLGPGAAPAHATGPMTLSAGQITDQVGAVGAARDQVQAAIDRLYQTKRIDLHVAYVDDFSGENPTAWAHATADRSGMGADDVLLAVATSARQYAFSVDDGFPIGSSAMAKVATVAVEPSLRDGQWAAAAIGATQALAQAASGQPVSKPTFHSSLFNSSTAASSSSSSSSGVFWSVLGVLVLATLAIVAFVVYGRRREGGTGERRVPAGAPPGAPNLRALETHAAQLLIETDDAIKTSEEELGFAIAQFGQESATRFTETLETAKRELAEAFRLRSRLDADPVPAEAERYRILQQVVDKCTAANAALDAQTASFEQLRDLQHHTPEVLDRLDAQLAEAPEQIDTAVAALGHAEALYPAQALRPVAQNPEQARHLVEFASNAVAEARRRLGTGQQGQAAVATRSAQEALGQVGQLTHGVGRRLADLERAGAGVAAGIAEVDGELGQARGLLEGADPASVQRLAALDREAARIKAEVQAGPGDPLDRLTRLQAVDVQLDELLLGLRSERDRRAGAQAMLEQAVLAARSDVAAAEDFITTRRGAIGSRARTLQAEASRQLAKALGLAADDPGAALEAAGQASAHARAAQQQADADLRGFGGPRAGPAAGGGALGGLLGAMLGGLAVQSASGALRGGRRRVVRAPGGFQGAPGFGRRGTGGRF